MCEVTSFEGMGWSVIGVMEALLYTVPRCRKDLAIARRRHVDR
jgi:hypothetical protein